MCHASDPVLDSWAEFSHCHREGLGYSHLTTLAAMAEGKLSGGSGFGSRVPRGVTLPGFKSFVVVERALSTLRPKHRVVASLEYGLLRPDGEPLRTQKARAAAVGLTPAQYHYALSAVRERVRLAS